MTKIIAEIGQNHEGDWDKLYKLTEKAIELKADYIKFQYWNIDNVYHKNDVRYSASKNRELDFDKLIEYIKLNSSKDNVTTRNIILSCFGLNDTQWNIINNLVTECFNFTYKYASSEFDKFQEHYKAGIFNTWTNKPIVSLGYYSGPVEYLPKEITYLNCLPEYPTIDSSAIVLNAAMLNTRLHNLTCGLSDHSIGLDVPKAGMILKLPIIEKHFTLKEYRERSSFRDHICSMDETELAELINFRDNYNISITDKDYILKDESGKRRLKLG